MKDLICFCLSNGYWVDSIIETDYAIASYYSQEAGRYSHYLYPARDRHYNIPVNIGDYEFLGVIAVSAENLEAQKTYAREAENIDWIEPEYSAV